jgi:predicted dehydrogenase/nucleoside-diphosphate-sugar epimerase
MLIGRVWNATDKGREMMKKRVLICGHTSFAAGGLAEALRAANCDVVCFARGSSALSSADTVYGPVLELPRLPGLDGTFDCVVNYILLKDEPIAPNIAYLDALLRFCTEHKVGHLIHISSVSVYAGSVRLVTEDARVETDPAAKGSYGALKVATDQHLLAHVPADLTLTLVRPGFILGEGLADPIVGMAFRTPWNRLLLLGSRENHVPMTTRHIVNRTVAALVVRGPAQGPRVTVVADAQSPTRAEYMRFLCTEAGFGEGVWALPTWLWWLAAAGGECVARILRMKISPLKIIGNACRCQRFDGTASARALGLSYSVDWRREMLAALGGQTANTCAWPEPPPAKAPPPFRRVAYIGCGRIVRQKHLPALRLGGHQGEILRYDVYAGRTPEGHEVRDLAAGPLDAADLYVVASPGPVHSAALASLQAAAGTVLVEKPLCYTPDELERWTAFAAAHPAPVLVCHNYRFKDNTLRMLNHLRQYKPGRLIHAHVHFQSPPVVRDGAAWLRRERQARTLLMDYSLHFLDVACMFSRGAWRAEAVRHEINGRGETSLIEGRAVGVDYTVSFVLRQGFAPRRARVEFVFENYTAMLSFFPDTFTAYMTTENAALHRREARDFARATRAKILAKLVRENDVAHLEVYRCAASDEAAARAGLRVTDVAPFYRLLFEIASMTYAERPR